MSVIDVDVDSMHHSSLECDWGIFTPPGDKLFRQLGWGSTNALGNSYSPGEHKIPRENLLDDIQSG